MSEMYLRESLIENVGPISALDVSLELAADGQPKPVVLVGMNVSVRSRDALRSRVGLGLSRPRGSPTRAEDPSPPSRGPVLAGRHRRPEGVGQTVGAFCAACGIGESTFFAKRRELTRRERSQDAPA
jgi:hypothetical protein